MFLAFTICYTYQLFYVLVVLTRRAPKKVARANHRYAVMVAARNEETVIADLIHSIKVQNYPAELIDIFVIADNCTDNTADVAREAGAIVFPRSNDKLVGKGYALDYGLKAIWEQYADRDYEAFFVFDADNVLDVNYFREMNATFDNGAKASTSYRNSKNFGSNWISAGYGVWFLREAKFLNQARLTLNTSCAVSGTGFFIAADILEGRRRLEVAPAHRGHRVLRRLHHRRRAHRLLPDGGALRRAAHHLPRFVEPALPLGQGLLPGVRPLRGRPGEGHVDQSRAATASPATTCS